MHSQRNGSVYRDQRLHPSCVISLSVLNLGHAFRFFAPNKIFRGRAFICHVESRSARVGLFDARVIRSHAEQVNIFF